jgi:DNA-binding beta-propeller fold protein YncE
MKTTKRTFGIALALAGGVAVTLMAQDLYVANSGNNTIGEYGLDGRIVNASLITGLGNPAGMAISGNDLFVVDSENDIVDKFDEHTTAGTTVTKFLIIGLNAPTAIAVTPVPKPGALALAAVGLVAFLESQLLYQLSYRGKN